MLYILIFFGPRGNTIFYNSISSLDFFERVKKCRQIMRKSRKNLRSDELQCSRFTNNNSNSKERSCRPASVSSSIRSHREAFLFFHPPILDQCSHNQQFDLEVNRIPSRSIQRKKCLNQISAMTARIMRTNAAPLAGTGDRIPAALQMIFIKGQQGEDLVEPPSDHSAFKVFPVRHAPQVRPKLKTEKDVSRFSLRGSLRRRNKDELDMGGSTHSTASTSSNRSGPRMRRSSIDNSLDQLDRQLKQLDALSKRSRRGGRRNPACPSSPSSSVSKQNSGRSLASTSSAKSSSKTTTTTTSKSPKIFVDVMLRTRGYSQDCFSTLETSYFNEPTELQKASYHATLEGTVRSQNSGLIRDILKCGISLNPCNHFGESIMHTACRLGLENAVRVMLECGASVQVSDRSGRTPLHAALSSCEPSKVIVELLLKTDRHLLHLKDQHGATPLEYIKKEDWGKWIDFLYSKRDAIWPHRNKENVTNQDLFSTKPGSRFFPLRSTKPGSILF